MDIESMKVADLKKELKARNLPCAGTKAELAERLRASVKEVEDNLPDEELSDEGLLNEEEEILLESETLPTPVKSATVVPSKTAQPKSTSVVKTAAALQKEGVLLSMEDNLFSDVPQAPEQAQSVGVKTEKLKARAARFGLPEAKLEQRAKKFGVPKIGEAPQVDAQKLLERAKRFNIVVGDDGKQPEKAEIKPTDKNKAGDLERLRKRAARFGENGTAASVEESKNGIKETLAKRSAKFETPVATPTEEISEGTENSQNTKRKRIVF